MKRAAQDTDAGDARAAKNERGRAAGRAAVSAAKQRGAAIINNGAGTMPIDAPAPYGGVRYSLLTDNEPLSFVPAMDEDGPAARDPESGALLFPDAATFRPNLTPKQCIRAGVFGGCYFNPKGGKSGIFGRDVAVDEAEFPADWFSGVDEGHYRSRVYRAHTNKHGVKSGQDQAFWEAKGWIHERDPRGWFQWFCRFYQGRRSADDARQIKRWEACAGVRGRWRGQLCGKIRAASENHGAASVSPVIRQTLLHWAYELNESDWREWQRTH